MVKIFLVLAIFILFGHREVLAGDLTCKIFLQDSKNDNEFEKDIAYINGAADASALWTAAYFNKNGNLKLDPLRGHTPKDSYKWVINYCVMNPNDGVVVAVNKMVYFYAVESFGSKGEK